jgi:hypothetical protein
MSCGNRFQCGITRFQKHSFTPDKPSNQELHNENQKRLNDLLKAREEIDKQFFTSHPTSTMNTETFQTPTITETTETTLPSYTSVTVENYTYWTTPSASNYSSKTK